MQLTATTVRRGLYGVFAGGLLTAGVVSMTPATQSAPDPCSFAGQAQILGSVSQNIGNYLVNHPRANQALTDISRQPEPMASTNLKGYFREHPNEAIDLRNIQAPLAANQNQCGRQVNATDTAGGVHRI